MSPLAIQGDTIYDLPAVANAATEVPGALWEVEVLAGPVAGAYVNKKLTTEQYVEYLRGQGLGGGVVSQPLTDTQQQLQSGTRSSLARSTSSPATGTPAATGTR